MKKSDFDKYLRKNPAPELQLGEFCCAAVIPVYDEESELPAALQTVFESRKHCSFPVPVVLVVNEPAGKDDLSSQRTLKYLCQLAQSEPLLRVIYLPQLTGGVGKARKVGMDAVAHAAGFGNAARTVIFSLDADTHVEKKYFSKVYRACSAFCGALTIGFRHRQGADGDEEKAIRLYEKYLAHYVTNLRSCGSPYAFQSIGSAFAVRLDAYTACGGMRVREAGEDFYFLQAVAKGREVKSLDEVLVKPSARISLRVPFGTGQEVRKIVAGQLPHFISAGSFEKLALLLKYAADDVLLISAEKFMAVLPEDIRLFFDSEGFAKAWSRVLDNLPDDPEKRQKAFHNWFDGLKTLRFLHFFEKKLLK